MKRLILGCILINTLFSPCFAQKKQNVLLTVGKQRITLDEFLRVYERNNSNIQDSTNKKTPVEYLDLYTNFKLKVLEAENLGMDTTAAFRNELAGYRAELAAPYLTDVSYNDELVKETYQRMLKEVNASHIMIRLPENPIPDDTLAAYARLSAIRDEILAGMDFNEAAAKYSQDPSAETNRGDLGWFTVFQMVYPFETAAYTTPVGQVSKPFASRYGYHLVKVNAIRDAEGDIHVAHIMKTYQSNATPEQKNAARRVADSLYMLIQSGADFAMLARNNSDDQRSAEKGGEMPWFNRSRMIATFADPAFALQNDGEISKPIDSGFGFHIIKRLGLRQVPSFEEARRDIEERLKRDKDRNEQSQDRFVSKLKTVYPYTSDKVAIEKNLRNTLSALKKDTLEIPPVPNPDILLFTIGKASFTVSNWIDFLKKQEITSLPKDSLRLAHLFKSWENERILAYEDSRLEEKYPDFKSLMEEYHDGMLLFDISESKIWQKASADTTGLEKFYEINKQKYLWPERFKGMLVQCYNPSIRDEAEKYMEMDIPVNEIYDILKLSPGSISVTSGVWEKNENPVVDYYYWNGPLPKDWNNRTGFIQGKMAPPEPKLLDEVRGYHIADYQQYLEDQWIKELRKKYKIKINHKLLKTLTDA